MAASAKLYGKFLLHALNGDVDLGSDTLKVMLTTSSYTPDQDSHEYKSSVTNEVTGTNYTAGGAALTSLTAAYDSSTNTIKIDAADSTWATATVTARYAVIYDSAGASDAARVLVSYVDFGTDQSSSAGDFTIQWNAGGIATVTVS